MEYPKTFPTKGCQADTHTYPSLKGTVSGCSTYASAIHERRVVVIRLSAEELRYLPRTVGRHSVSVPEIATVGPHKAKDLQCC